MKLLTEYPKPLQFLIRLLIWLPIAILTMMILMRTMPIRTLFGFKWEASYWGPPQSIPFSMADLVYRYFSFAISILYSTIGVFISTKIRINSTGWWKAVSFLYILYIIIVISGLIVLMDGWFSSYGHYFLDVILGPPLLLAIIEGLYALTERKESDFDSRGYFKVVS